MSTLNMLYNPYTDKARTIEELAEESRRFLQSQTDSTIDTKPPTEAGDHKPSVAVDAIADA